MNRRRTIWVLVAMLCSLAGRAQTATVHFGYDANGNRISRTLTVRKAEENGKPTDTLNAPALLTEAGDLFGAASLSLYPNPTRGKVSVALQGTGAGWVTARLVTPAGTILQQRELKDGTHDFDLTGLPPGIYLLQLSAAEVSQTWKIIKQ